MPNPAPDSQTSSPREASERMPPGFMLSEPCVCIDLDELAKRVYALMKEELRQERERMGYY